MLRRWEWVFLGRWLFLDNPQAATIVADRAKLARVVDETFRSLYPLCDPDPVRQPVPGYHLLPWSRHAGDLTPM